MIAGCVLGLRLELLLFSWETAVITLGFGHQQVEAGLRRAAAYSLRWDGGLAVAAEQPGF